MTVTPASTAVRGVCAFAFVVCAVLLSLAEGSVAAARRAQGLAGGPAPEICSYRAKTGAPCLGCGGTEAFGHAARGRLGRAVVANPLGAWTGASVWALLVACGLTFAGAGTGILRAALYSSAATLPAAFFVNAIAWWTSVPR